MLHPSVPPWIARVRSVLAGRGVSDADRAAIVRALWDAPPDPRLRAMLNGDPPPSPAVVAPFDAVLNLVGNRLSFTRADGSPADWRYRIDPARLRVAPGSRVHAGEQLTDGEVWDSLWLDVFGDAGADRLRAKLVALTGLDVGLADLVLAPMLDAVTVEPEAYVPGARPHAMTRGRFARVLADRAARGQCPLEGRRALFGYRVLARMDAQGQVLAGPLRALEDFMVTRRRLALGDAAEVRRRPECAFGLSTWYKFGAVEGRWKARVVLTPNRRAVSELWAWHHAAQPWLDASMRARDLEVASGRVLLCDLTRAVWEDEAAIAAHCAQQVGGASRVLAARVSRPGVEGVVCALPAMVGRYRVYVQHRDDQRVEAVCLRFHDEPVL
jgi:hypothetical protein